MVIMRSGKTIKMLGQLNNIKKIKMKASIKNN
jgi:hypothetical protein